MLVLLFKILIVIIPFVIIIITVTLAVKEMPGLMSVLPFLILINVIRFVAFNPNRLHCLQCRQQHDLSQVHQTEVRTFQAAEGSQDCGMPSHDCSGQHQVFYMIVTAKR